MNNEPVAWIDYLEHSDVYDLNVSGRGIPLYTHPADLTDEEISDFIHRMVLCCQVPPSSADINVLGLKFIVEDILRKAQEK